MTSTLFTSRRVALLLAAVIGAVVAVVVGYLVYVAPRGADATTFRFWIAQPIRWYLWAVAGALVGLAVACFRRLEHQPK